MEKICPNGGCKVGDSAYIDDGVLYCCYDCATDGAFEYGCCDDEQEMAS